MSINSPIEYIRKFTKFLHNNGSEKTDPFEFASIRIVNLLCILASSVSLLFLPVHLFISQNLVGTITCVVEAGLFALPVILNYFKRYNDSKIAILMVVFLCLSVGVYTIGNKTQIQIFSLVVFNLIHLLFLNEARWKIYLSFFFTFALYFIAEYDLFGIFSGITNFSESTNYLLKLLFQIATIVIIGIMTQLSLEIIHLTNREKERINKIVKEQRNDIAIIFQNLKQGIFIIGENGKILPEISKQLLEIIERPTISGLNLSEVLAHGFELESDSIEMIVSTAITSIGEHENNFYFNEHLLPKKLAYSGTKQRKFLEVDWVPVIENAIVIKILVSIKDDTELIAAKEMQQSQEQAQNILVEIINSKVSEFDINYSELTKNLDKSVELSDKLYDKHSVIEMRRHLHTLKGEARFLGWKTLARSVNDLEMSLDKLGINNSTEELAEENLLSLSFSELQAVITQYKDLYNTRIKQSERDDAFAEVRLLVERKAERDEKIEEEDYRKIYLRLQKIFTHKSLSEILSFHYIQMNSLARELGKTSPTIIVKNNGLLFERKRSSVLTKIFSHLLTNAMDHGIESPSIRKAQGKPEAGKIVIESFFRNEETIITMRDDGQGLDLSVIKEKADQMGLKYSEQFGLSNLIFESGLSTKSVKTEYSGHGVGLNAVHNLVEQWGGTIIAKLDPNEESATPHVRFHFEISLPKTFALSEWNVG